MRTRRVGVVVFFKLSTSERIYEKQSIDLFFLIYNVYDISTRDSTYKIINAIQRMGIIDLQTFYYKNIILFI